LRKSSPNCDVDHLAASHRKKPSAAPVAKNDDDDDEAAEIPAAEATDDGGGGGEGDGAVAGEIPAVLPEPGACDNLKWGKAETYRLNPCDFQHPNS
jgi:hypothetical protein